MTKSAHRNPSPVGYVVASLLCLFIFVDTLLPTRHPHKNEARSVDSIGLADRDAALAALELLPRARTLFRQGKYAEAGNDYDQIIRKLPESRHATTAAALLQLRSPGEYSRLLARLYNNRGLCHLRGRRGQLAQQMFEKALSIDRSAVNARSNLGLALLHLKHFPGAIHELEAVRAEKIGDAKLHLDLGKAYLGAGEFAKARWALMQSMRLGKRHTDLQSWGNTLEAERCLAEAYEGEQNLARAEHHLRQVLHRAGGDVQARYRLHQILVRQARTSEAEKELHRFEQDSQVLATIQGLLGKDPDDVTALQWIADTYRRLGLLHLADVHYRQLIARKPGDNQALMAINHLNRSLHTRRKHDHN